MRKIVAENLPFVRHVVPRAEALERFGSRGEKYKVEIIESIPEGEEVSYFQHGDFIDLCRGPHVERTGDIKAFKLLSFAGAYWRGDERNADAAAHLRHGVPVARPIWTRTWPRLEEAKRRDHRTLGKELDLFSFDDLVGAGLRALAPEGRRCVRYRSRTDWRENIARGYELVYTPHVAREQLLADLGPPRALQGEHVRRHGDGGPALPGQADELPVPHRDLPVAAAAATASCRCATRSSARSTATSARACCTACCACAASRRTTRTSSAARTDRTTRSLRVLDFALEMLRTFGFNEFELYLATRPESFVGEPAAVGARRGGAARGAARSRAARTRSTRAAARSTGRRSTSRSRTRSAASGSARPSSSTSTCPSASTLEYIGEDGSAPPADHDPPRAARLDGALLRRADRALRGRVPALAGAGAGAGAPGQRAAPRPTRSEVVAPAARRGAAGRGRPGRPTSWAPRFDEPSWRRSPTCWWSAKRNGGTRRVAPLPGRGSSSRPPPLEEFAAAPARRGHAAQAIGIPTRAGDLCWQPRHYNELRFPSLLWTDLDYHPKENEHPKAIQPPPPSATDNYRVGHRIRVPEVRVIGADGADRHHPDPRGAAPRGRAGAGPRRGQPAAVPPVCKIMDFGKFKYETSKKKKAPGSTSRRRDQGDQAPSQDGRPRSRLQGEAHPRASSPRATRQARHRLPRPRDATRRRGRRCSTRRRGGRRHRDGRAEPDDGRPAHADDHRAARGRHPPEPS